jgi:hypothetical protein
MSYENPEYRVYAAVATYLKYQYPNVLYHFDPTGLHLTKTQAGMLKAIQGGKGYPDLFIIEPSKNGKWKGLFIEIKHAGTKLLTKDCNNWKDNHITTQAMYLDSLRKRGFFADFCCGFDKCKKVIDLYLKGSI